MKFLYATDPHLKGKNPARRTDNYPVEILMLIDELRQVAEKEKVTAVLIGGDVLDTPKISQKLFNKLSRALKRFPCPIYVVPGNHDVYGQNADTLEETQLGNLDASGVVTLITRDSGATLFTENSTTIAVYAQEFTESLDEGNPDDYDITPYPLADYHILMTHSMLTEKPFIGKHTLIKNIQSRADVILGAHYHPGFDIIEHNDIIFCGPGAMARMEGTVTEATRTVQYAIIDADDTGIEVNLYPFKNAKPGKDILDLVTNAQQKQKTQTLETFRQTVDDATAFEGQDIMQVLRSIVQAKSVIPTVYGEAKQAIVDAEQMLEDLNLALKGFVESPGTYRFSWMELHNFQSHKGTHIDFHDGLNAITGASDSGKTAIIRALRWVLYNDPKGADFITHGESKVIVRLAITDGISEYILERQRTKTSAGHYKIFGVQSDGSEKELRHFTGFGNNVPIEIAITHQMPKTQLTKDLEVSLNMSHQLEGPFLLDDAPSVRAAVIGRLTGVQLVDTAIRETTKKVINLQRDIKSDEKREQELDEALTNNFGDIAPLEQKVNELELLIQLGEATETKKDALERMRDDYKQATADIKSAAAGLVQIAPKHKALSEAVPKLEDLMRVKKNMENTRDDIQNAQQEISLTTGLLENFKGLAQVNSGIIEVQDKVALLGRLKSLKQSLEAEEKAIQTCDDELSKLSVVDTHELDTLEEKVKHLQKLKYIQSQLNNSEKESAQVDIELVKINELISEVLQMSYRNVLTDAGRCPVCATPIDDTIIDKITL